MRMAHWLAIWNASDEARDWNFSMVSVHASPRPLDSLWMSDRSVEGIVAMEKTVTALFRRRWGRWPFGSFRDLNPQNGACLFLKGWVGHRLLKCFAFECKNTFQSINTKSLTKIPPGYNRQNDFTLQMNIFPVAVFARTWRAENSKWSSHAQRQ